VGARGVDGRRYAWGDNWDPAKANVDGRIGHCTCVGLYPRGATPDEDIHELTGNCWEWCLSAFESYEYRAEDRRNEPHTNRHRVVRGGSWFDGRRSARAAYRYGNRPVDWGSDLGCRLVLSLADSVY
jgi:formylglycine-generating enzyme required for sulfatase activity